jgi:hypothetical protein
MLPLQLACVIGRAAEHACLNEGHAAIASLGKYAMELASELFQWHHVKSDGLVQGITKLHLASRMNMAESIPDLLRSGYENDVSGYWPGIEGPVTCENLGTEMRDDDLLRLFSDLTSQGVPDHLRWGISASDG